MSEGSEESLLRSDSSTMRGECSDQTVSGVKLCLRRTCTTMNTIRFFWIFGFLLCSICVSLFTAGPHAISSKGDMMGFWQVRSCPGGKNCTISTWTKPEGCRKFGTPVGVCCAISAVVFFLPVLLIVEAIHKERKRRGPTASAFGIPQRNKVNFIVVILSSIALLLCYIPSTVWTIECVWDWCDSPNNSTTKYTSYWGLLLVPIPFVLLFTCLELTRMCLNTYAKVPVSI